MGHLDFHRELILDPPLNSGVFLVIKSKRLNLETPKPTEFVRRYEGGCRNLYRKRGGIALRITISKVERALFFNSRIGKDNSKGWGIEEKALFPPQLSDGPHTLYVHDQDDKYQVMLGVGVIHTFLKRIDTSAAVTKVEYTTQDPGPQWDVTLSKRLNVSVCTLGDISNRVWKAIARSRGLKSSRCVYIASLHYDSNMS